MVLFVGIYHETQKVTIGSLSGLALLYLSLVPQCIPGQHGTITDVCRAERDHQEKVLYLNIFALRRYFRNIVFKTTEISLYNLSQWLSYLFNIHISICWKMIFAWRYFADTLTVSSTGQNILYANYFSSWSTEVSSLESKIAFRAPATVLQV